MTTLADRIRETETGISSPTTSVRLTEQENGIVCRYTAGSFGAAKLRSWSFGTGNRHQDISMHWPQVARASGTAGSYWLQFQDVDSDSNTRTETTIHLSSRDQLVELRDQLTELLESDR